MSKPKYAPRLSEGMRVVFTGREHDARNGRRGAILAVLPNPSCRPEHQWYDVRFDDYTSGRFLEKYLHGDESDGKNRVA